MYDWIKAFHIIAVIAWMAGMLYLPRLFVYHCAAEKGFGPVGNVQGDGAPAAARHHQSGDDCDLALGLWLAWLGPDSRYGWFASGGFRPSSRWSSAFRRVHGLFARWVQGFRRRPQPPHRKNSIGIINEVPTVLMIAIVILVVLKPF